ncbi:MAG: hypothetical protein J0H49_01275 [Acidobacteria bacterium]|nr:hypothetical protein [Acidobacteriota bacterium]
MSVISAHKAFGRLAMLVLAGALAAPLTFADTVCDASSLKGAFSFRLSGSSWDSQGYLYFHGVAGRLVSDGAGALTGSNTYNYDGTVYRQTLTGSYTISDDCTGTVTLTGTASGTTHYDIVLTNNGQEAEVVQTDSGLTLSGSMKMQNPAATTTTPPATTPANPAAQGKK